MLIYLQITNLLPDSVNFTLYLLTLSPVRRSGFNLIVGYKVE